jgi:hypothetical protein
MTVREAAEAYASRRQNDTEQAASAEPAATDPKLADEANAAPAEQANGETQEPDPAEKPSIEPPRSWTKEAKERWDALPPETQEYLAQREQERDREVRRSQNEAAEHRKAFEAERAQVEQARKEYEAKLPAIMQALQDAQAGAFADIKTVEDVQRLAAEDPFRYLQWQAHQDRVRAVNYEMEQANQRQQQEQSTNWTKFQADETAKAAELHPELADPVKAKQLQEKVVELFRDKGFTDNDLNGMAAGEKYSPFDHRWQSILVDALKYREAQKAKPVAVAKPVPQVQRPGVAQPKGAVADANVQALSQRLSSTGSIKDAFALYQAEKKAG